MKLSAGFPKQKWRKSEDEDWGVWCGLFWGWGEWEISGKCIQSKHCEITQSAKPSPQKGMHALKLFLAQKRACIGIEAVSNLDQSQKYIMCRMKSLYGMNSRGNIWRLYGLFNK